MVAVKDVLRRVAETQGTTPFSAQHLRIPVEEFQVVVDLVRGAYLCGFIETLKEHKSSITGQVDCVWAEGLTDDGRAYLDDQ